MASSSSAAAAAAVSSEDKARAEAFKAEGNEKYKAGQYNAAIDAYGKAIAVDPANSAFYANRAAAAMMCGRFQDAVQDCDKAIELRPDFMKAYMRGATARLRMGDVEGAMNMHTRAHLRDPRFDGVKAERLKATKTMKHLERAREAARDKKWAEAKRELVGVRAEVKSSTEVDILEAEALLGLGKVDEAMALITDVVRTGEGRRSNRALTVRANCLYLQGNLPQAQRHLSEVMKMDPDNTAAGQLLKAIRKQEALKAEGNEAFRTGNNEAAVTAYTACIDLGPESKLFLSTVFANRAAARMRLRQWELASADCDACLDLNDQYIKGYLRRAECAQKIGGKEALERALRDLNAAKDLAPDSDTLRSINRDIPTVRRLIKVASKKDFYKTLGVPRSATTAEIKKAYRKLTLKHHPDKLAHKSEQERKIAESKIKELNEAWDVLSDESKKRRYDAGVDPEHLDDESAGMGGMGGGMGGMGGMGGGMGVPPEVFEAMFGAMGGGFGMGGGGMGGGRRRRAGGMPGGMGGGMPGGFHYSYG